MEQLQFLFPYYYAFRGPQMCREGYVCGEPTSISELGNPDLDQSMSGKCSCTEKCCWPRQRGTYSCHSWPHVRVLTME